VERFLKLIERVGVGLLALLVAGTGLYVLYLVGHIALLLQLHRTPTAVESALGGLSVALLITAIIMLCNEIGDGIISILSNRSK
jgi:hypothetical protein